MSGERDGRPSMAFGPFRLVPARHLLLEGETPVAIGGRAFDILVALVERAGEVVGKDALIARAWPDTVVEEGNLRLHIATLRRTLRDGVDGNRFITTIAGRGYSFVAPVATGSVETARPDPPAPAQAAQAAAPAPEPASRLPSSSARIVGRAEVVNALCEQVSRGRLVTVVGPGGIGKTTVALAAARQLAPSFPGGAAFVDLSRLDDPKLAPAALAAALGLSTSADNPMPLILGFLKRQAMVLVLDSCEHLIEVAANIAEEVCSEAPSVHMLATSREPLRAAGERVHRLAALASPIPSAHLSAADALSFASVQLFVERAAASVGSFTLTDADAPAMAEMCRRLDGMPLAIELAAGRVAAFGIADLAARLDDRFALLTSGRRTALPRHQTLAATLDWSYRLLPDAEQALLRSLAVLAGDFTLEAAAALAADVAPARVVSQVAELVQKSLVVADVRDGVARYRLLDTTRLYSLEKLRAAGEHAQTARRLAIHLRDILAAAKAESETRLKAEWLASYGGHIDNLRAALEWAFSAAGDAAIGAALAIVAVPLWVQLSRMDECRTWAGRALAALAEAAPDDSRSRMELSAALGWSLMYAVGRAHEGRAAWDVTLREADRLGDADYRLRALFGLWINHLNNGEFRQALARARHFAELVAGSSDAIDRMMADRILGVSLHFSGDQTGAGMHIERMLARHAATGGRQRIARFQFDEKVTAHYFQARILWLQGAPDRALRVVEENIAEAEPIGHALSFGSVLGQGACPVALLRGDLSLAERFGGMLLDHADRFGLRLWSTWARCYNGVVLARQGDAAAGLAAMRAAFDEAGDARFLPRYRVLIGEFAACLAREGEVALGLATAEAALEQCERNEEGWYVPELLRIKGEIALGLAEPESAEALFRRAAALAAEQGARAWELRAAIGLAGLPGDPDAPRRHLAGVLDGFSEGHETADLRAARRLLDGMG